MISEDVKHVVMTTVSFWARHVLSVMAIQPWSFVAAASSDGEEMPIVILKSWYGWFVTLIFEVVLYPGLLESGCTHIQRMNSVWLQCCFSSTWRLVSIWHVLFQPGDWNLRFQPDDGGHPPCSWGKYGNFSCAGHQHACSPFSLYSSKYHAIGHAGRLIVLTYALSDST